VQFLAKFSDSAFFGGWTKLYTIEMVGAESFLQTSV
jgi:hypothetical protein